MRSRRKLQFDGGFAQQSAVHLDGGSGGDGTETDSRPVGSQGEIDFLKAVAALHLHLREGRLVAFAANLDAPAARRHRQGLYRNGADRSAVDGDFGPRECFPRPAVAMGLNAEAAGEFLEGQPDLLAVVRTDVKALRDIAMTGECGLKDIGSRPQEVMIADAGGDPPAGERESVRGGIQVDRHLARRGHEPHGPGQRQQERTGGKDPEPCRRAPHPVAAAAPSGTEGNRCHDDRFRRTRVGWFFFRHGLTLQNRRCRRG